MSLSFIVLIPPLLCLFVAFREGTTTAFRKVVVPTMLLLPMYFVWTARPLPDLNFLSSTLLAMGFCMIVKGDLLRWQFKVADLWILMFIVSTFMADRIFGRTTDSTFNLFDALAYVLVPYMAGKLLIELPGERDKMLRTYVWCMTGSAFLSVTEYVAKTNPYKYFWEHFFGGQYPRFYTQIRWGGGRIAGPFGQSELAGMMAFAAWLLALYLGRPTWQEKLQGRKAPLLRGRAHIWILFFAMLMTQARGPWIGAGIAFLIASIGIAKRPVLRAIVVVVLIVGVGVPAYVIGKSYTAGPRQNYGSEKETAQYREELIANYIPVAEKGGDWGYGKFFPIKDGQGSVDNEYLLLWLTQGQIGLMMLLLLIMSTCIALVRRAVKAQTVRERHFALTMLGIFAGMCFTISTVFLGMQSYELFFLIVGWSQGVRPQVRRGSPIDDIRIEPMVGSMRVYS